MNKKKHAYLLCSGGLDSVVASYLVSSWKKHCKFTVLFFNYGQNSLNEERKASERCAKAIHARFVETKLPELKGIAKGKKQITISKSLKDTKKESESWYVPCRNTIFLAYALAMAEKEFIDDNVITDIFVGFKSEGKEPFPDATQSFLDKLNALSKESCAYPFVVSAPLINKDKEEIVLLGQKLNVELEKTFSCYSSKNGRHCGVCLACRLRKAGFYWAGIKDETDYIVN